MADRRWTTPWSNAGGGSIAENTGHVALTRPEATLSRNSLSEFRQRDFGFAGEQAREAAAAAVNNGARERAEAALAQNQDRYALINAIAFGLTFVLLIANMWVMTKRRPYTRG